MPLFKTSSGFEVNFEVIPNVVPENTVFIHGNLASNRWWYPTEEEFRKQSKTRETPGSMILIEFLGCGKSEAPKTEADVNMRSFAREFNALIKSLKLSKVNVVGHSTGGVIASLMVATEPTLFNKAVLLDPVGPRGVTFNEAMVGAFEAMKTNRALTATVLGSTIYNNDEASDFFQRIVVEDAFHAVKTVGYWVLKALDGLDITSELKSIARPVLVLHGEHDTLLPIQDSQDMAALIPDAKFEVIKNQGHCVNAENPSLFAGILNRYLYA